ncbi:hypothetical protein OG455_41205 [Kitasatospora sp. NBC_01287]|uniref:hypothetical protein n=1 Tax=Kitasatospora sp. NBC_01287 TaxID=2903573 RepID=UPI00225B8009|nr:hypothetical protein [Kitasatospora sp. NBC_01287]MCX4750901.1 hypothetical protein [Kitasatospora sp. NBC_01287]MCX4751860.1 hypothetical protein [Kitasatospora sp. NBC_01287]
MTTPSLPLLPNDELVAAAWLGSIPGLTPTMVGTQLPPDVDPQGLVAPWIATGFITVSVIGGTPDPLLPINRPVLQVDCWAAVPGSNKPPWHKAAALASAIRYATWDRRRIPRPLALSAAGVTYPQAVVQGAYLATAFRRLYDDQGDYACYQGDLVLSWVAPTDVFE